MKPVKQNYERTMLAGLISSAAGNNLRMGILAAVVFPVLLVVALTLSNKK